MSATMFVTILQEVRQLPFKFLFLSLLSFAILPALCIKAQENTATDNQICEQEHSIKTHFHDENIDASALYTQKLHHENELAHVAISNENRTLIMDETSKAITIFYAFISATLVGLSGIVPLVVFPLVNIKPNGNGGKVIFHA